MESDALTCPFCGAPYRDTIPSGTMQVKCQYCGAAILVPAYFGGSVNRCPNHPNVAAVGLCNDCGRSYCEDCLSLYSVEHGKLYLCPGCFENREGSRTIGSLLFGVFVVLFGFFVMFVAPAPEGILAGATFIGVIALPFLAWGLYRSANPPHGHSLKEMKEEARIVMESRKVSETGMPVSSLYDRLLNQYLRAYDPRMAYDVLERQISYYTLSGMSRKEAVRRLAEEKGYA